MAVFGHGGWVGTERLISRYSVLYYMAEDGSWEGIRRLGLLSTSALLDRFQVEGRRWFDIESCRRPGIVEIRHPDHGLALVRDNKPMQEKALRRCLTGMEPRDARGEPLARRRDVGDALEAGDPGCVRGRVGDRIGLSPR